MSSALTSPTKVRRFMLDFAKANKAHSWSRVSQETLDRVEMAARREAKTIVLNAPSRGKTL